MSFFSGAGMFDWALLRAGMQRVGACEIDRFARKVYTARLGAPDYYPDDVTKIVASEIPDADVWIGGSPCQSFSVAGARAGLEGTSGLLLHWISLAKEKKPTWFLLENVPGMLTGRDEDEDGEADGDAGGVGEGSSGGSAEGSASWFGEVLRALADAGYRDLAWRCLDGQWFGVAQRRRRIFLLARHSGADVGNGAGPCEVLFEPEGVRRDLAARGEAREVSAGRTQDGAGESGVVRPVAMRGRGEAALEMGGENDPAFALRVASGGSSKAMAFVKKTRRSAGPNGEGETWGSGPHPTLNSFDVGDIRTTAIAFNWQAGGSKAMLGASTERGNALGTSQTPAVSIVGAQCAHDGKSQFNGNQAVASGHVVAHGLREDRERERALTTSSTRNDTETENFVSHDGVRRLTPMECERLQGLPDGWSCVCGCAPYSTAACRCPDGPRYKVIGNGGVTHVVEWIGRRLMRVAGGIS